MKTEKVALAKSNIDTNATARASIELEKSGLMDSLTKEKKSGLGPKCDKLQASIDACNARLDSLAVKTEVAQVASVDATELSVLAKEFKVDENTFMKIMVFIFLTIANVVGFWLVFLSSDHSEKVEVLSAPLPLPVVPAAPVVAEIAKKVIKKKTIAPAKRKPKTVIPKGLEHKVLALAPHLSLVNSREA